MSGVRNSFENLLKRKNIRNSVNAYNPSAISAAQMYKNAAESGHIEAQYAYGKCCYDGVGVEQNFEEAVKWLNIAAENGNKNALVVLAHCYMLGNGVKEDPYKAASLYEKSALAGNAEAQLYWGVCLREGVGVESDLSEAFRFISASANQNNMQAIAVLGDCYLTGVGVQKNYTEGFRLVNIAANNNIAEAQGSIGYSYYVGRGVSVDYRQAVAWWEKAANNGDIISMNNLGHCYVEGIGVSQNVEMGIQWLEKAAKSDYFDAIWELGCIYTNPRIYGIQNKENEGVAYLNLLDQNDFKAAGYALAAHYLRNNDSNLGIYYLERSANLGYDEAQIKLGEFYAEGNFVSKDDSKAFYWFLKACYQGNSIGKLRVGLCYVFGTGCTKDEKMGTKYISDAALLDNLAEAKYSLAHLYYYGTGVEENKEYALMLFKQAAAQGYEDAKEAVEKIESGKSLEENSKKNNSTWGTIKLVLLIGGVILACMSLPPLVLLAIGYIVYKLEDD